MTFSEIVRKMNPNIKLAFGYSILQSFGRGIWMSNVLSAYIFFLTSESNKLLGWTSAATGITMTIFVLPSGFLADRFRRDILLRSAALAGLIGLLLIIIGNNIVYVFVALSLWGLYQALTRPSLEALIADSLESGTRTKIYSWLHLARQISSAIGPFFNIFLFLVFGNEWELSILKNVMILGMSFSALSIILLFLFSDKKSLGKESESIPEELTQKEIKRNGVGLPLSAEKAMKLIPILLVVSNVIIGFGAGMTIKFFPIFFLKQYELPPISVQIIMGLTAIFTGLSALLAQKYSLKKGRAEALFLFQLIATICLFVIAIYPPLYILIPIFIARGSLMNAGQPLSRSILMDVVNKKNRAKWNSLEAIAWGLFWNVSAVIGGYLVGDVEPYNFRLNFLVTGGIYILGLIPIIFLIPLVGKERIADK
ncbi:MAG: MFS transporter [Candidatus Heimdallarchaeaceae archaeon]